MVLDVAPSNNLVSFFAHGKRAGLSPTEVVEAIAQAQSAVYGGDSPAAFVRNDCGNSDSILGLTR